MSILLKLLQSMETEGTLPNSFYKMSMFVPSSLASSHQKIKVQINITYEYQSKKINTSILKRHTLHQVCFISRTECGSILKNLLILSIILIELRRKNQKII